MSRLKILQFSTGGVSLVPVRGQIQVLVSLLEMSYQK
jgi:hypothetical protein